MISDEDMAAIVAAFESCDPADVDAAAQGVVELVRDREVSGETYPWAKALAVSENIVAKLAARADAADQVIAELDRQLESALGLVEAAAAGLDTAGALALAKEAADRVGCVKGGKKLGPTGKVVAELLRSPGVPELSFRHFLDRLLARRTLAGFVVESVKDGKFTITKDLSHLGLSAEELTALKPKPIERGAIQSAWKRQRGKLRKKQGPEPGCGP